MEICSVCRGKKFIISNDHQGIEVIQRCDECNDFTTDLDQWLWLCPHQSDVSNKHELFGKIKKIVEQEIENE